MSPLLSPSTGTGLPGSRKLWKSKSQAWLSIQWVSHWCAPGHSISGRECRRLWRWPNPGKTGHCRCSKSLGKKKKQHMGTKHLRPYPAVGTHKSKIHFVTQDHVAISRSEAHKRTRELQAGNCLASCLDLNGFWAQYIWSNLVKLQRGNWSSFRLRKRAMCLRWLHCIYPVHSASTQKVQSRTTVKPPMLNHGRKQIAALISWFPACSLTGGLTGRRPPSWGR